MAESRFRPEPIILEGRHVRLEPLSLNHASDLFEAGHDPETWAYLPEPTPRSVEEMARFIDRALREANDSSQIPFAMVHEGESKAVGSTRYLDIRPKDRALEIGWTWIGPAYRRTVVNTECKFLLLRHAFETLGAVRVQFKTDERNIRSQNALERLGAAREGTLRQCVICWNGFLRSSVYYSVIDKEWPAVKARLESKLGVGSR